MAAITQEQKNILTQMGQHTTALRKAHKALLDQMGRYTAAEYPVPTDEELEAAGFDYTSAKVLAAVDSANELKNFFDNLSVAQGEHGVNFDVIRKG